MGAKTLLTKWVTWNLGVFKEQNIVRKTVNRVEPYEASDQSGGVTGKTSLA